MQLVDNINILRKHYPGIWQSLSKVEEELAKNETIDVTKAKSGKHTLLVRKAGGEIFIHSKYDPKKEAERFVSQYGEAEIDKYQHVFFYGLGFGYHVEEFAKRFSLKSFSIYEPNPVVFYKYLTTESLSKMPLEKLKNIYIEMDPAGVGSFADNFLSSVNGEVLFVVLPSYERIFAEAYQRFSDHFLQAVRNKRSSLHTNLGYQKRWVLNSLINFKEVVSTPNILHDIDRTKFNGKPALLVAAGPSLDEEIENIRYIKENNLAYIFSVGSAINTLIEHDTYPHAACSYDPSVKNQLVFEKIAAKKITSIPLIFGSSIGFEALRKYPGEKLHMVTSQDTVTPYLLGKEVKKVDDAPSIAVLTINMLLQLGFNPVILVGQNLAIRNDKFYAGGISYHEQRLEITDSNKDKYFKVEDVYGNKTYTTEGFVKARRQMEQYIQAYSNTKGANIINTSKGGAKIAGTSFIELKKVVKDQLNIKEVVDSDWFKLEKANSYDLQHVSKKLLQLEAQLNELVIVINNIYQILRKLHELVMKQKESFKLEKGFKKLDKAFKQMKNNDFYKVLLAPMNRVQYELLGKNISSVRFEKDLVKKAPVVINEFGKFLEVCMKDLQITNPILQDVKHFMKSNVPGEIHPPIDGEFKG